VTGSIARRYAKAIAALATEEGTLDATGNELHTLARLAGDREMAAILANPLLSSESRRAIGRSIAEQLRLGPTTRDFLLLLADHQRLDQLVGIDDQYRRLVDKALGRVRARIRSAADLTADQQRALMQTLEKLTGKTVLAEYAVEADLLGGVLVEVEGKVYDGSVRTQLRRLATTIAGGRSFL
jgi:F-type H+-transporting ATPase subunit delta